MAQTSPAASIVIAEFDPRWPAMFEEEAARILESIGQWLVDIQHVGSTAVPGLAAKSVIDIAAALRSLADGQHCVAPLEALGYEYRGEMGIAGRFYFRKPTDTPGPGQIFGSPTPVGRTHHLHMYEVTHEEWQRHLLFRDYLRQQPAVAARYAELKRRLAAKFGADVDGYSEAKGAFIRVVLGRARLGPPRPVRIVDYDPRWPALYEEERARILDAIDPWLVDVQHVGSTAVPGLAGKPVIDMMVALRSLNDARPCIAPLEALGYEYVPEYEVELPERRYFRKKATPYSHHLHMVEATTDFWRRHLLFRDYLRRHPDVAREYGELKKQLAALHGSDHDGYTDAKTEFIRSVEARAFAESNVGRGPKTRTEGARP